VLEHEIPNRRSHPRVSEAQAVRQLDQDHCAQHAIALAAEPLAIYNLEQGVRVYVREEACRDLRMCVHT